MVKVDVTDYDIEHGKKGSAVSCPLVHAVNRVLKPNYKSVVGFNFRIYKVDDEVYKDNSVYDWTYTSDIGDFTNEFDGETIPTKREFQFEIPTEYLK